MIAAAFWPRRRHRPALRLQDERVRGARSAGRRSSPRRRTRCSASAAPRATTTSATAKGSPWSAGPCGGSASEMGLRNVKLMVPFCRTPAEGERVLEEMAATGWGAGENGAGGLRDVRDPQQRGPGGGVRASASTASPSASNDLTQLVLGVDRDSRAGRHLFDERERGGEALIRQLIEKAHAAGRKVGICGQAPSDYPEFAASWWRRGSTPSPCSPTGCCRPSSAWPGPRPRGAEASMLSLPDLLRRFRRAWTPPGPRSRGWRPPPTPRSGSGGRSRRSSRPSRSCRAPPRRFARDRTRRLPGEGRGPHGGGAPRAGGGGLRAAGACGGGAAEAGERGRGDRADGGGERSRGGADPRPCRGQRMPELAGRVRGCVLAGAELEAAP